MSVDQPIVGPAPCSCGTQIAPTLLACPACGRLVHADRLQELAAAAHDAAARGDPSAEIRAWRDAMDLLPRGTRQHAIVLEKIDRLGRTLDGGRSAQRAGHDRLRAAPAWLAALGAIGLLLWKFKFIAAFILTKGKLLVLGLTKSSTLFSMVLSLGVYWTVWGWKFALGIIVSIYIHEMGHVAALKRFGFQATAPMFIPGIGALIRMRQHPSNPREDARIGLAGPIWGLGAAIASLLLWQIFEQPIFAAIARVGAWINLFNLLPIWFLDGSRGFRAMSRVERWLAVGCVAAAWLWVHDGMLLLVLLGALFRAIFDKADPQGDRTAAAQYIGLVAALSALVYWIPAELTV